MAKYARNRGGAPGGAPEGAPEEHPEFGGFDDFWKPSSGPIGPILYGFVVPRGTTKP